ncbi:MAG TPA: HhH-GPD-type base excision DNA repair protein [Mycobacteriales bacterium]|nr:HhH-GPD-type base excision DNA repair protein [Mycobacteriales bacterium]
MPTLHLSGDPEADALLSRDSLALLVGMLLDQQIPIEKAFRGPHVLLERLGHLDAASIASHDPDAFAALMATPPAVHRFPQAMAARVQALCRELVESYDGRAEQVWSGATTGVELLSRLQGLPGFGVQKAQIFLALLGKQRGVRPRGWRQAAGPYGAAGSLLSVADITSPETLLQVRAAKRASKLAAKAATGGG